MQIVLQLDIYFFIAVIVLFFILYFLYREFLRDKSYYKSIVDNSQNIVMLVNQKRVLEVNKTFFSYFKSYKSIEEFSQKHTCFCEFFDEEDGYLDIKPEGEDWVQYLVARQSESHKIKLSIDEHIYYFLASASVVDAKRSIYSIILTDISEQVKAKKALTLLTLNDTLTNIGNRRFFDQKIQEHITLSQRYNAPFSFLLLDIDFFKKINDRYGHDVGDQVLVDFTALIKKSLREGDIFARIGGEEFAILLPFTTKDKGYILAQKLRETVESARGVTPITVSIGLVQYEKGDDEALLFKRVDALLYKAKESGRNKVVLG